MQQEYHAPNEYSYLQHTNSTDNLIYMYLLILMKETIDTKVCDFFSDDFIQTGVSDTKVFLGAGNCTHCVHE